MSEFRVDEYVRRIQEVKEALEGGGWVKVREDEWRNAGQSVRFSYAHKEFRIFVKREPHARAEQHNIHVRDEGSVIPTVKAIIEDILELRVKAGNAK